MHRFSILAATWLVAFTALILRPGDPSLDSTRVHLGADTLAVAVSRGGQTRLVGAMFLQPSRASDGTIDRKEHLLGGDGLLINADSFALDGRTFAPVYRILAGAVRRDTSKAFHPNSLDIVLAGLPLTDGYSAELALDAEGTELPSVAQVRVIRAEDVRLVIGTHCPAWMVETTIGRERSLYWIGQGSGALLQYFSPSERMMITRTRGCPES